MNNSKNRTAMNAKISVFVNCVEAIIYLLLSNLHDCVFNIWRQYIRKNGDILITDTNIHANYNRLYQANIYLFKSNKRNTRKRCEICSKLPINIRERRPWHRSNIVIVNFEHISHLFLVFILLTWTSKSWLGMNSTLTYCTICHVTISYDRTRTACVAKK